MNPWERTVTMIMLGFIVILLAALVGVLGVWLTTSNGTQLQYSAGMVSLELAPVTIFIAGMVTVALLWLGLRLIGFGTKRTVRSRRERRQLIRDQKLQESMLAETRAKLERERASNATTPRSTSSAPTDPTPGA